MKKVFFTLIIAVLLIPLFTKAQSQNIFLERSFWSSNPSIDEIKEKINQGNDPLELSSNSYNATAYAITNNQPLETVKFLLSIEGNAINTLTHDGRVYVHWAAMKGNLELVKYLIEQGGKTDIVDDHGYSVLNFAAATGSKSSKFYDFLLSNGSSLSETDHHGANALLLTIPQATDFTLIDYFIEKGLSLSDADKDGNGAFYYAAKTGNIEMMDKLIEKGVDYKGINKVGGNAMIAAAQGYRKANTIEVFQYLEGKGIEANVSTKDGTTPLHLLAGRSKETDVISYFIGKGVNVNQVDGEGNTALIYASQRGSLKIIKLLADQTKDINAANNKGETALTNAVAGNSTDIVAYLIENGADANVVDKEGNNIGFYLMKSFRSRRGRGSRTAPGQSEAEGDPFMEKLEMLKKKGFDPTSVQAGGKTFFHLAAEQNDMKLLKKVHRMGVNVNKANKEGTTPLQIAAMKATDDKILKYMLEIGADKSVTTSFDETVYDLASENEVLQANNVSINFLK